MPLLLNLRGAAGANGTNGAAGANGTNGTNGNGWLSGVGVPSDALGNNGDFYMNETNSDVYKKVAGTWV